MAGIEKNELELLKELIAVSYTHLVNGTAAAAESDWLSEAKLKRTSAHDEAKSALEEDVYKRQGLRYYLRRKARRSAGSVFAVCK